MAPTNRLIEARRAELRAEANTRKPSGAKTAGAKAHTKRATVQPKAKAKA
ncbi:MAG: hypothetical protein ACT4O6_19445 [Reyranella sp.]